MTYPKTVQTHTGTTHENDGPGPRPPGGSTPDGTDTNRTRHDTSAGSGPPGGTAPGALASMTGYTSHGTQESPGEPTMVESGVKITHISEP